MLENHTETLVRDVLQEYRAKDPICDCSRCEDDIVAAVLNDMPPMYFLSEASQGEIISYNLSKKLRFEALIKITEAVKAVSQRNHP